MSNEELLSQVCLQVHAARSLIRIFTTVVKEKCENPQNTVFWNQFNDNIASKRVVLLICVMFVVCLCV